MPLLLILFLTLFTSHAAASKAPAAQALAGDITLSAAQALPHNTALSPAPALPATQTPVLPLCGLVTQAPKPVLLPVGWNDAWFGEHATTVYHHGIARIAVALASSSYDSIDTAHYTDCLSRSYQALGVEAAAIEYHYDIDYSDSFWGNDQCAFSFAHRTIESAQGKRELVFIVIRGTPLSANEWLSNLEIGNTDERTAVTMHAGFLKATDQLLSALTVYLTRTHIDSKGAFFLITGHSRGGAVANLTGARLAESPQFSVSQLYVYTFAAPNVTTENAAKDSRYDFIWNIVNAEDVVPTVPPARNNWQFKKYGHVLSFTNAWNARTSYRTDFLPRMNAVYRQFMLRDYEPFESASFIPIQISRVLTQVNKTIDSYNGKVFGIRSIAGSLLKLVFPPKNATQTTDTTQNFLAKQNQNSLISWLNMATDGLLERFTLAGTDMHAPEQYLSHLLAFEADELYTQRENVELVITGSFEGAVFDKNGTLLAQILDGRIIYKNLQRPLAAFQLSPTRIVLGCPDADDFVVVIYHPSLIPTPVSVQLEHYSASGSLLSVEEKKTLYLHRHMAYRVLAGESLQEEAVIEAEKIHGKTAKRYIKDAELSRCWDCKLLFETNLNSHLIFSGGVHIGPPAIYGTALFGHRAEDLDSTLQGTALIGTQQLMYGRLFVDIEGGCHFVQDFDLDLTPIDESQFYFVPTARISLSLKPRHRIQFFAAFCEDVRIQGFNEGAFDNALRKNMPNGLEMGIVSLVPTVQLGIKF